MRRLAQLLLVVLALASFGAFAGAAKADIIAVPLFDFCKSAAPHKTLTLGPGIPSVQTTSSGIDYSSGLCPRFVTDIVVPTSTSGGSGYFDDFQVGGGYGGEPTGPDWSLPLNEAHCDAYVGYLRVYRKTNFLNSEFSSVGGGTTHGNWVGGGGLIGPHCELTYDAGYVQLPYFKPPVFFGATYRVAVATKIGSVWTRVRASAWHPVIIY
jgi:hypothetical protein